MSTKEEDSQLERAGGSRRQLRVTRALELQSLKASPAVEFLATRTNFYLLF